MNYIKKDILFIMVPAVKREKLNNNIGWVFCFVMFLNPKKNN